MSDFVKEKGEMPPQTQEPEIHSFSFYQKYNFFQVDKKLSNKPLNQVKEMGHSIKQVQY